MALAARDGIPRYEEEPGTLARFASLAARRFADTRKFRALERRENPGFCSSRPATKMTELDRALVRRKLATILRNLQDRELARRCGCRTPRPLPAATAGRFSGRAA